MKDLSCLIDEIARNLKIKDITHNMIDLLLDCYQAEFGSVLIHDPSDFDFPFTTRKNHKLSENSFKIFEQETGVFVLEEQKPLFVKDENDHPDHFDRIRRISRDSIENFLVYPIMIKDRTIGTIHLYNLKIFDLKPIEIISYRLSTEIEKSYFLYKTEQLAERQRALTGIISQIITTLDREQLLRMIIDHARRILNVEATSLFLVDENSGDIVLRLASNLDSDVIEEVEQVRIPYGKGIIGYVIQTGETVLVDDTTHDHRHYSQVDSQSGFATHSILAVPLKAREVYLGVELGKINERIIGGIEAINKINGRFTEIDSEILRTLTDQAATVMEIARLYSDTNELFIDVIEVLSASIDAKDPYTEGHSQRVSQFSIEIAYELGLTAETIQQIKIGGLLHDVGKIGIPDAILGKPGKLTEEEYEMMKNHPAIGAKIMQEVRMLNPILPALSAHHERLDGLGYPFGLTSSEIPLISRIISVADVFDAMTSNRPYRKAIPAESAFKYLLERSGTCFDNECIHALQNAYEKGRIFTQVNSENR